MLSDSNAIAHQGLAVNALGKTARSLMLSGVRRPAASATLRLAASLDSSMMKSVDTAACATPQRFLGSGIIAPARECTLSLPFSYRHIIIQPGDRLNALDGSPHRSSSPCER